MSVTTTYCGTPTTLLKYIGYLVFDTSGNLYAANFGSGGGGGTAYVVKIDTAGNATLLSTPIPNASFIGMYYLNGFLYVCGYNHYVYKISTTTGEQTIFSNFSTLNTNGINGIMGITYFAPYFYVTANTGQGKPFIVRVNESDGSPFILVSQNVDNSSYFKSPRGITVDATGNLYVVANGSSSVLKFNNSGTFISQIITGYQFNTIVLTNNYFYFSSGTNYVHKFDLNGVLISSQYAIGSSSYLSGGVAVDNQDSVYSSNLVLTNGVYNSLIMKTFTPPVLACFNEGSLILTDKGYIPVQDLRKGDLIKTEKNDFIPIDLIGFREIYHHATETRIKEQLYKCSKEEYPQLIEDLILTGCHSILIEDFSSKEEREYVKRMNGNIYRTGGKFRLPAYLDNRSSVYEVAGNYTIYHLALENDADYLNYGIYANGLLVETSSKRCLQDRFNMI